jgi:eukaryotic-like serine/threonine-protein kinase
MPASQESIELPVIGGYVLLDLIGRGGMGSVFRARQLELNRIVALKWLTIAGDRELAARFRQEAESVAGLHHPHVAQLYEIGKFDGRPYYTMEYCQAGSLAAALRDGPLSARAAAHVVAAAARGIHHAHERGVVHRDVKPGNILLDGLAEDARAALIAEPPLLVPKVADFGLARRLAADQRLTQTGEILGTPGFLSPEQASGAVTNVGPPADVYSLGAVLYECLTGRPPFVGPDPVQTVLRALTDEPIPPSRLAGKLPADLDTIVLKCLEKSPRRRYASAAALADDLDRFLDGRPIVARAVRPYERAIKWARRNPWVATAVLLMATLGIGSAIGVALLQSANVRLAAQKLEADHVVSLVLFDLDRFMFDLSDKLYELPGGEKTRREVLDRVGESLAKLDQIRPTDPNVRSHQQEGYDKLANAEARLGRLNEAYTAQQRSYDIASKLAAESPDNPRYQRIHALMASRLAILLGRLGRTDEAERRWSETVIGSDRLREKYPESIDVLDLSVVTHAYRLIKAITTGSAAEQESVLTAGVALRQQLERLEPNRRERILDSGDAVLKLASWLGNAGRAEEAKPMLDAVAVSLARQPGSPTVRARRLVAWVAWGRGDLESDPEAAEAACREAIRHLSSLSADFPAAREYDYQKAQVLWSIGRAWKRAGKLDRARPSLKEAKAILEKLAAEQPDDKQCLTTLEWVNELLEDKK